MTSIYGDSAVIRRIEARSSFQNVTSNGTLAASVMVIAALVAVALANSSVFEGLHELMEAPLLLGVGSLSVSITFEAFVNDFLMAIFFLLVGIELKYEFTVGQLRRPRQAALPMLAAVGGVLAPALIYLVINRGGAMHGWATPIATDIAFALGVMSLLGERISCETKVFFQTLAIADDILAIVVIALSTAVHRAFPGVRLRSWWCFCFGASTACACTPASPTSSWVSCCGCACTTRASTPRSPASSSRSFLPSPLRRAPLRPQGLAQRSCPQARRHVRR